MTNFEYIKAMSIEEMTIFLNELKEVHEYEPWLGSSTDSLCEHCKKIRATEECSGSCTPVAHIILWLNQEHEE